MTGGTTGIGLQTAKEFLAEGARVAVTGLAAQKSLAGALSEAFGKVDVAFLNAGIGVFKPLDQWDEASYDRSMAVNLKGPFFLLQALLPVMADPASVILMSSVNAHVGMATSSVYSATKAALRSLSRTLSAELIGRGIRINTLSPGPVTTPIYGKLGLPAEQLQGMADAILSQLPARRFGTATEIAKAAVYLASDESAFAIGSEVVIDGGFSTL